jgi:hypothetical protein
MKTKINSPGATNKEMGGNQFTRTHFIKRILVACIGAFLCLCSERDAAAQAGTVYSINIVGLVADRATILLTQPLTTQQRQAIHANNFNQLAPSARALYLRAVAFQVGTIVKFGEALPSAALADYLQTAPQLPQEETADLGLLTHKAIVKEAMRELNLLIVAQVVNAPLLQQAMEFGATDSFMWLEEWW